MVACAEVLLSTGGHVGLCVSCRVHWLPLATCTPYPVETGIPAFIKSHLFFMVTVCMGRIGGNWWQL